MKDEIVNEAINALKEYIKEVKDQTAKCKDGFIVYPIELSYKHVCFLLNYITNLQEENMKYDQCLTELTDDYKNIQKEITNLQEELKSANESITWWQNRFNAVEKENEKLKVRNKILAEDITRDRINCDVIQTVCGIPIEEIPKLKEENEKLKEDLEDEMLTRKKAIEYCNYNDESLYTFEPDYDYEENMIDNYEPSNFREDLLNILNGGHDNE